MMVQLHEPIDRLINFVKWPSAAASILILLPSVMTFLDVLNIFVRHRALGLSLLTGMFIFAAPMLKRRRLSESGFWSTFEHELAHAFFALFTLHPIHSLQATSGNGGSVGYSGRGNWLITIAPYFFPTIPLVVGLLALSLPKSLTLVGIGGVGFALAWHLLETFVEIHAQQSDLHDVGFVFAAAFVPGASIFALGFVLAITGLESAGAEWFFSKFLGNIAREIGWIKSLYQTMAASL